MQSPHQPHLRVIAATLFAILDRRSNRDRVAAQHRPDDVFLIGLPSRRKAAGLGGRSPPCGRVSRRAGKVAPRGEIIAGAGSAGDFTIQSAGADHDRAPPLGALHGDKTLGHGGLARRDRAIVGVARGGGPELSV
ncbi:conserved hypothetical protein [Ricinus communis]|uniref:Uncharacterized protein n=1 Tax=Ricinus communis TaxID=3988 RepID=B9TJ25_RICCO|nr:conserved hypothetical protein [Ricinus communis]